MRNNKKWLNEKRLIQTIIMEMVSDLFGGRLKVNFRGGCFMLILAALFSIVLYICVWRLF